MESELLYRNRGRWLWLLVNVVVDHDDVVAVILVAKNQEVQFARGQIVFNFFNLYKMILICWTGRRNIRQSLQAEGPSWQWQYSLNQWHFYFPRLGILRLAVSQPRTRFFHSWGSLGLAKHKHCLHLLVASSILNSHHNHVVPVHQNKHFHTSIHHPLAVLREERFVKLGLSWR